MNKFPAPLFIFILLQIISCRSTSEDDLVIVHRTLLNRAQFTATTSDSAQDALQAATGIELTTDIPDSQRIRRVMLMAKRIKKISGGDSALKFLLQAKDQFQQTGDSLLVARIFYQLGNWTDANGSYRSAVYFGQRAVRIFDRYRLLDESVDSRFLLSGIRQELGDLQLSQRDIIEAIDLLLSSKENLDSVKLGIAYRMSANVYSDLKVKEKAVADYEKAIGIFLRLRDTLNLGSTYANLGLLYRKSAPDSARWFYEKALALIPIEKYPQKSVIYLFNRANIETDAQRLGQASRYYDSVLATCLRFNIITGIPRVYSGYASLADRVGRYEEAIKYWDRAIQLADSLAMRPTVMQLMREKQKTLELSGDLKQALNLSKQVKKLEDSLTGVAKLTSIKELELQYETERREEELSRARSQRKNLYFSIIILSLLAASALSGMFFYRDRNRKNAILVRQFRESLTPLVLVEQQKEKAEDGKVSANEMTGILSYTEPAEASEADRKLFSQLELLMSDDAIRSNDNLRTEDIARRLGISARKLSVVVRMAGETSFIQYLNRKRVEHAARLLDNNDYHHLKLETIGKMAGFSSRTNFYRVFEQITGVRPGLYRQYPLSQNESENG